MAKTAAPQIAMPPMIQAIRLSLGPPQALTMRLPASMPKPAAENTAPAAVSEAKETIKGMTRTFSKASTKLTPA